MQLFISKNYKIKQNSIFIEDKRIIDQLRKVLRAKTGYKFYFQDLNWKERLLCEIKNIKNFVEATILETTTNPNKSTPKGLICAILNKFSKMELIIQKISEIGLSYVYFFPAKRSQFKEIPSKKLERMQKIALEATEQSFNWKIPEIKVIKNPNEIEGKKLILDFDWIDWKKADYSDINYVIVGPEWGFTEEEIKSLNYNKKIKLWNSILRAETAAIIGSFLIS